MYGSYSHADDNNEESASGSFNIASFNIVSLVDSSRKYYRRMGKQYFQACEDWPECDQEHGACKEVLCSYQGWAESNDFQRKMSDIAYERN